MTASQVLAETDDDSPNFKTLPDIVHERDPRREDFVGKKIVDIDFSACNVWRFKLEDEDGGQSTIAIEADVFSTQYGGIPVMQVCEPCGDFSDEDRRGDRPVEDQG